MTSYKKIIDKIAEIEHSQWMHWSMEIAKEEYISDSRLKRWQKLWKPYAKLSPEEKDEDREWAEKAYNIVPIKCPVWQCGGIMQAKERKPPIKGIEEYDGDYQTPNLICEDCGATYEFKGFKQKRKNKPSLNLLKKADTPSTNTKKISTKTAVSGSIKKGKNDTKL